MCQLCPVEALMESDAPPPLPFDGRNLDDLTIAELQTRADAIERYMKIFKMYAENGGYRPLSDFGMECDGKGTIRMSPAEYARRKAANTENV